MEESWGIVPVRILHLFGCYRFANLRFGIKLAVQVISNMLVGAQQLISEISLNDSTGSK